jgi:hypothetical protein
MLFLAPLRFGESAALYTTPPWHALCEEVERLKIDLAPTQEAEVIELAKYANSRDRHLHCRKFYIEPER